MTTKPVSTHMMMLLVGASTVLGGWYATECGTIKYLTATSTTVQILQAIGEAVQFDPARIDPPEATAAPQPPKDPQAPSDSQQRSPFDAPAEIG